MLAIVAVGESVWTLADAVAFWDRKGPKTILRVACRFLAMFIMRRSELVCCNPAHTSARVPDRLPVCPIVAETSRCVRCQSSSSSKHCLPMSAVCCATAYVCCNACKLVIPHTPAAFIQTSQADVSWQHSDHRQCNLWALAGSHSASCPKGIAQLYQLMQ